MKPILISLVAALGLGACAMFPPSGERGPEAQRPDATTPRPAPRPAGHEAPPENAVTVEDFDTTTAAERAAATAAPAAAEGVPLGVTIATLGSPTRPGFWLETPLVSAPAKGRVVATETGKSVLVDLIPLDAPAGAGSRLSLAALRLLGVPLGGLHELKVSRL